MEPISVGLVADSPDFRSEVVKILGFDRTINIIGEATDTESATRIAKKQKPKVILFDLNNRNENLNGSHGESQR